MDFIREFSDSIGLQAETFDYLIIAVIIVGGIWAAIRFYQDMTRSLPEEGDYPMSKPKQET